MFVCTYAKSALPLPSAFPFLLTHTPQPPPTYSCLKPTQGARVVYSTCSISPTENDGVVSKLLKRNPEFRVLTHEEALGPSTRVGAFVQACQEAGLLGKLERSECGWWVLPDANAGWGPIFFSVLERSSSSAGCGGVEGVEGDGEGGEGSGRKYRRPKPERPRRRQR